MKKKNFLRPILLFSAIILLIGGIMLESLNSLDDMVTDSIHQTLTEVSDQQQSALYREIVGNIDELKIAALALTDVSAEESAPLLRQLTQNMPFSRLILIDADGHGTDGTGQSADFSGSNTFRRAMAGEVVVGTPESFLGDKPSIPVAVPRYGSGGAPSGVLLGSYSEQTLADLTQPIFGGNGQTYLVTSGSSLTPSVSEDKLNHYLEQARLIHGSVPEQAREDMLQRKSGHTVFELDDVVWYCHYNPTGIDDWYLFTLVREDSGGAFASAVSQQLLLASSAILFCLLLCGVYIFLQRRKHTAILERMAYRDELCDCPNLSKFKQTLQRHISSRVGGKMQLVKFDISEFKLLNSLLGDKTGNEVLIQIAETLHQLTPPECFCRAHDDEFYALLRCDSPENLNEVRITFLKMLHQRLGPDFSFPLKVVAGHYFLDLEQGVDAAQAVERANIAHRRAKELGVEVCVYDDAFTQQALWNKWVESRMEAALAQGAFKVYLQAQYTLDGETVSSAEALARWVDEEYGLIAPNRFIPVLEEKGIITKLDFYIFEQVCRSLREWMDAGVEPIEIAVNFSRKHLGNPNLVQDLCDIADRYHIPHRFLSVELTESTIWENEASLLSVADQLHRNGFLLAMDDFGSGYSSLGLLKNLPVDILKIDRAFFTDNRYKTRAKLLISGVMHMASELGMVTLAEGVEEQEHIDFLREVGCDKVQGYYYERPLPIEDFLTRSRSTRPPASKVRQSSFLPLGDIAQGRGALGTDMPVHIHRLFHSSVTQALSQRYGEGESDEVLRSGGWITGRRFAREALELSAPFDRFMEELSKALLLARICRLTVESVSDNGEQMVFRIENDLDSSGLGADDASFSQYNEGLLSGLLYEHTNRVYSVVATSCCENGARFFRFVAKIQ